MGLDNWKRLGPVRPIPPSPASPPAGRCRTPPYRGGTYNSFSNSAEVRPSYRVYSGSSTDPTEPPRQDRLPIMLCSQSGKLLLSAATYFPRVPQGWVRTAFLRDGPDRRHRLGGWACQQCLHLPQRAALGRTETCHNLGRTVRSNPGL